MNCYECGNTAKFTEINPPFLMYCLRCIKESYPPKEREGE